MDSKYQPDAEGLVRRLADGSIRHVTLQDGVKVAACNSTEIFVRLSGRGRILWPTGKDDSRDHRAFGLFLIPPERFLSISGDIHGLRVELPDIEVDAPARPLSDVLISLACRRAWYGPLPIAEVSLKLASLLVIEEIRQNTV